MSIKNFRLFLNQFDIIFFISLHLLNTQLRLIIFLFWTNRLHSIIVFIITFSFLNWFCFFLLLNYSLFIWLIEIFGISIIIIIQLDSLFSRFWFCRLWLVLMINYLSLIFNLLIYLRYFPWMICWYRIAIYFFLRTSISAFCFNTLIFLSRIFIRS